MLLLLLLFQQTTADLPQAPSITKNITSCPDVGYFFQRDVIPNAIELGPCLLCFCRDPQSAVCWRRERSRCDTKSYKHYGIRETRVKRSPAFTDIFFRDAARDIFDKRISEQCKPYESSFSEGCPPADWCIGCTVCDCDANGRWDCHILSFCPNKNGKKQENKQKVPFKKRIVKRNDKGNGKSGWTKKAPNVKSTKPMKKPKKQYKPPSKKPSVKKPNARKNNMKNNKNKKIPYMNKTQRKPKKPTKTKPANRKFMNKKPSPHELSKKSYRSALQNVKHKNDTYKLAEAIVKRVMSKVDKIMSDSKMRNQNAAKGKVVQKRSMQKHYHHKKPTQAKSKKAKQNKTMKKVNKKPWNKKVTLKKQTGKPSKGKRQKRSVTLSDNNHNVVGPTPTPNELQNFTEIKFMKDVIRNSTTISSQPINYYRYDINTDEKTFTLNNITSTTFDGNSNMEYNNDARVNSSNSGCTKGNTTIGMYLMKPVASKYNDTIYDGWEDHNETLTKQNLNHSINTNKKFIHRYQNIAKKTNSPGNCKLKRIFKEFFFGLHSNNTEEVKAKVKSVDILSVLKNLLKNIFDKKKSRSKKYIKETSQQKNILNSLCKNFGACHPDLKDKALKSKLKHLKQEIYDILKIVRSIKGLLYLLNNKDNVTLNTCQKNDIEKLKVILREHYLIDPTLFNVTETQRIQVNYIKQNAQEFVKSLEKFAFTLSDILNIIEKQHKYKDKNYIRPSRCTKNVTKQNSVQKTDDKINRLKKLLLSYNLVQNRFMSKMYDALLSLQGNVNDTNIKHVEKKVINSTVDAYSESVIRNLKKLKNLSQRLNPKKRLKREAMGDEDAIEYLLMLMEYLLKQNKPVDVTPVKDGIDLLLDAIKNAPDIKLLRNNVAKFKPVRPIPTRTTESSENDSKTLNTVENKIMNGDDNIIKTVESFGDDHEESMKFIKIDKYVTPAYDSNVNIYNPRHYNIKGEEVGDTFPVYISTKQESTSKGDNFEDKLVKSKYDIFNADAEEEYDGIEASTKKSITEAMKIDDYKFQIEIDKEKEKLRHNIETDIKIDRDETKTTIDANIKDDREQISPKLDWVEDTMDQDVKMSSPVTESTTKQTTESRRTHKARLVTRTSKKRTDKYANPVSGMSSEEIDTKKQNKKSTDVVRVKPMDLFNSLDYNTDKMEIESDSKEDKNDAFSDFV
ncbi:uncharacterized protein LOC119837215 [Zerene cesonia]|uniref:uncharacterized protein LOC119837215 n=1 Tax=Zerene cesonia TaxID=33412 RepID=UPI0018E51550|nr:uncharacterized protein LOC119837215 [Zerene cesonia]